MRYPAKKSMLKKEVCLSFILLFAFVSADAAELGQDESGESAGRHQEYDPGLPNHESEGNFFFGYQWLDQADSQRAGEYKYLDYSFSGGLELNRYPLPHRINMRAEYLGKNDMYGDLGYAYKDLVLARDVFAGIYHNLDHYSYQYADTAKILNNDRNPADTYHRSYFDNFLALRLKAPDFPFHTYLKQRHIEKDGAIQQRSLLGSTIGAGNVGTKLSQTRDIDWQSDEIVLGSNSHLGPIELDYAYGYTNFDPGANNVLYDTYPVDSYRNSLATEIFPHDVNPKIESWSNTLKAHTSYTGRIVASASLSNLQQENAYSDSESNTWRGAADFKWMPRTSLGLFLKYRHSNLDAENPGSVTLAGSANTYSYAVRRSISSQKDSLSFTANYRPLTKITLVPSYEFDHVERRDNSQWTVVPSSTDSNALGLTAYSKPLKNLKFKLALLHKRFDNPAYNIEPDSSSQVKFTTTFLPTAKMTAFVDYSLLSNERDHILYLTSTDAVIDCGRRENKNERILGSMSFIITPRLTFSPSLAFQRNEIEQTIGYGQFVGAAVDLPFLDPGVSYRDEAVFYGLGMKFAPRDDINIAIDISHTDTEGKFLPGIGIAQSPADLASFSTIRVSETLFSVDLIKKIRANWEVELQFSNNVYNDKIDNALDSSYYSSIITMRRRF